MLGVILCGGQSSRMGTDKGLIKMQASTWAQSAAEKMTTLQLQVVLSVNDAQFKKYATFFSEAQLVRDDESINISGPLRGVLSIHAKHPSADLFVLACDMPLMEPIILKQLLACYEMQKAEAYVYTNNGTPEPLCGIYTASALKKVLQMLKANQLAKYSMKYMLEQVNTFLIPLTEDQKKYFKNFNAHAALNGL